jgi:hypothetical protein
MTEFVQGLSDVGFTIPAGGMTSEELTVAGIQVRVAGLDDIIASKEYAGRPKDHAALPELYRHRDRSTDDRPWSEQPILDAPIAVDSFRRAVWQARSAASGSMLAEDRDRRHQATGRFAPHCGSLPIGREPGP